MAINKNVISLKPGDLLCQTNFIATPGYFPKSNSIRIHFGDIVMVVDSWIESMHIKGRGYTTVLYREQIVSVNTDYIRSDFVLMEAPNI